LESGKIMAGKPNVPDQREKIKTTAGGRKGTSNSVSGRKGASEKNLQNLKAFQHLDQAGDLALLLNKSY